MRLLSRRALPTAPAEVGPRSPRRWGFRRLRRLAVVPILAALGMTLTLVLPWRWFDPPTTAFILRERATGDVPVYHRWVGWDQISPNLAIAAVAAEDQRFAVHSGFDWDAIQSALERNREGGRLRGGSTISQQLAKNLYLWPSQNLLRKGAEAYFTVWIELLWPKRRILEVYLNVAEFGPGVFGVGAASDRYLNKAPASLSPYDAAVLVAVLPSPGRMSATSPSDYVRARARQIQAEVSRLGGVRYLSGL